MNDQRFCHGLCTLCLIGAVTCRKVKLMRRPVLRKTSNFLQSREVASVLGISQRTLLRKLAAGKVPEPARDHANNYRIWRPEEVEETRQLLLKEKA